MPGWLTDNMPVVSAPVQNSVTVAVGGISNNGTVSGGSLITLTQVPATGLIPVDVNAPIGAPPQTVAATVFQIAAHAAALSKNTATSTAGAATLNTVEGLVTTEALTTAAGATYTFTLTNSLISAPSSPVPQILLLDGTNTAGATQINSITNGTGSVVAVFQNTGTAAWNGTKLLAFHI